MISLVFNLLTIVTLSLIPFLIFRDLNIIAAANGLNIKALMIMHLTLPHVYVDF